ncbi:MAG: hypothetical protein PHE06_08795, partial [Lachnospiraceae bacterium]|nr:hypothetical protein [Lachnospiraceae bacterium]
MEKQKKLKKLAITILLEIVGIIVLYFILNYAQTRLSVQRQYENSMLKLDIAQQRMTSHVLEAEQNLYRYDVFSQAKVNVLSYFYSRNPDLEASISKMASQWELNYLYILDDTDHHLISSNQAVGPDFEENPELLTLLENREPVTIGDTRYYTSRIISEDQVIVAGRECSTLMAQQAEITSPKYSLNTIRVGTTGFIMAVDLSDSTIAYHKDAALQNQPVDTLGIKDAALKDGYNGWITCGDTSYYSCCRASKDYLYVTMVPASEITATNRQMVLLGIAVFALVISLIVIYMFFIQTDQQQIKSGRSGFLNIGGKHYFNRTIWKRVSHVVWIGTAAIFCIAFYVESLAALSKQSAKSNAKMSDIQEIFVENEDKLQMLTEEYNAEYIRRAQNIAYLLKQDPALQEDEQLAKLAKRAQIDSIYIFDENGQTVHTNTVYKDFKLSNNERDSSYVFQDVIKGYKDVMLQEAKPEENSDGAYTQYVGVARMDAPGMVEIGLSPQMLAERLQSTTMEYILKNIAVENHGYAFAIDEETQKIVYFPDEKYIERDAAELGIKENA